MNWTPAEITDQLLRIITVGWPHLGFMALVFLAAWFMWCWSRKPPRAPK